MSASRRRGETIHTGVDGHRSLAAVRALIDAGPGFSLCVDFMVFQGLTREQQVQLHDWVQLETDAEARWA